MSTIKALSGEIEAPATKTVKIVKEKAAGKINARRASELAEFGVERNLVADAVPSAVTKATYLYQDR